MATEKRLIDANAVRHDICVHMAGVIHRGIGFIPSGKDSNSAYEFLRGYEQGAEYIANLVLQEKYLVDAVEVVHGRWVLTVHEEQCNFRWNVTAECSGCQHSKGEIYAGHFSGFPKELVESIIPVYAKKVKLDNYCPNCGAKMDGDGNGC